MFICLNKQLVVLLIILVQRAKDGAGNGLLGNIDDCLALLFVVILIKGDFVDIGGEFILVFLFVAIWHEWLVRGADELDACDIKHLKCQGV